MDRLTPSIADVQSHYDLPSDFFALFLDASMTYSCAYFERSDTTLRDAQLAKIDLALGKCAMRPGQRLLDIGCGWGSTMRRAYELHQVDVIGLTLSNNHRAYVHELVDRLPTSDRRFECRLQGWEQFDEPVDRIVSLEAFEHFRRERHAAFFSLCHRILPDDGRMLLQTIIQPDVAELEDQGVSFDHEDVLFGKFIRQHIFPGGQLCSSGAVVRQAERAGLHVLQAQSLRRHYTRTLEVWAEQLEAARQRAISLVGSETCERFHRYLTGCAGRFARGCIDVVQFTLSRS